MSLINVIYPEASLSCKTFFEIHLDVKETAQVGDETLYGPCWAVITAYKEPTRDKAGRLIWQKGEVRISAQNPVRRYGILPRGWKHHFHPQHGFRKPDGVHPVYWDLPKYTGEQTSEELAASTEWRIDCAGGYTPEAPAGWVIVSPTRWSTVSWLLLRENDPRLLTVEEF